ncbi:hypothetical protein PLICRDRAFT_218456 [Plicaturopsis crispa FD-325 SS-3]|nr:hypothetical protein PLICRDRAFT_218456 [Plicaturopsis crispa FD-325 SS-3]
MPSAMPSYFSTPEHVFNTPSSMASTPGASSSSSISMTSSDDEFYNPGRRTLNERCAVRLKIDTDKALSSEPTPLTPLKDSVPYPSTLFRSTKRRVSPLAPRFSFGASGMAPSACPPQAELYGLQEMIPGLHVAFSQDLLPGAELRSYPWYHADCFTHMICVAPSHEGDRDVGNVAVSLDDNGAQRLRLVVPVLATDDGVTQLSGDQLIAARDFCSLALPYSDRPEDNTGRDLTARVLITTPGGRAVDAVSIAICYMAYVAKKEVQGVMETFNAEEDLPVFWKGSMSLDGKEFLEEVAARKEMD